MRFSTELLLENEIVPKDKNRIIMSILKSCFSSYNQEYYDKLYNNNLTQIKNFTFALYLGDCKFLREEIMIPEKKIILNFSTYSSEDGIMFFNSFMSSKGKQHSIKNNTITIGNINIVKEKPIYGHEAIFKTMSPIVVREHHGDNKTTWYHSLNNETGQTIFMNNLQYQLKNQYGERVLPDFEEICVEIAENNKEVKVKNYGIVVLSNVGGIRIKGQPYILEYLYKAGIGSKRSSGFGMLDIV